MGPLLAGRRLAAALAVLLLAGCEREEPCKASIRTDALPAPYKDFFNGLPVCGFSTPPPIPASSSNGLSDSYSGSCVSQAPDYSTSPTGRCETLATEQRSITHNGSLYGFRFITQVEQRPDGPRLRVRDWSGGAAAASLELTYAFATGQAAVSYRDAASNTIVPFGQAPVVTALSNFQSGSRTYAQVWRLTNPLNVAQGRATAVTVLFVDRDYGLIRFEQRDGTVWSLNP